MAKAKLKSKAKPMPMNFYVGDPAHPDERGQDAHGYVHCLQWVYLKRKRGKFELWSGGSCIGEAKTYEAAVAKLHTFAMERLGYQSIEARDRLKRIQDAMNVLALGPRWMGIYAGEYKEKR